MEKNNNHYQVSCFVYYMANAWSKKEAINLYGKIMGEHFWYKWCTAGEYPDLCTMKLYYNMTAKYREMLVSRAIEVYENSEWINNQ